MPYGAFMYCNHEELLTPCLMLPNYITFHQRDTQNFCINNQCFTQRPNCPGVLDHRFVTYFILFIFLQPSVAMEKRHVNGQLPVALHLFFSGNGLKAQKCRMLLLLMQFQFRRLIFGPVLTL